MHPILIMAALTLAAPPAPAGTPSTRVNKLLDAMERVESGGRPRAVGDAGRSRGPLKMTSDHWRAASKTGRPKYDYRTGVWDRNKSREVTKAYWKKHAPTAYRRGDMETLAKLHHAAGPKGANKNGEQYWRQVKGKMR